MELNSHSIGVVIPAYNEEDNLPCALDAICAMDWLAQIVVVDDGSTDGTSTVAQHYAALDERLVALRHPQNLGKADALQTGVRAVQTDVVIFLDADLIGLQSHHLRQLSDPVLSGAAEMSVAVFHRGNVRVDIAHRLTPALSGQRCLRRRSAEQALALLGGTGYGIEIGLRSYALHGGWTVQYLAWERVTHVPKEKKRGWRAGIVSRWHMNRQVLATRLEINKLMNQTPMWRDNQLVQGMYDANR